MTMGVTDETDLIERAKADAAKLGWQFEVRQGSMKLLSRLFNGPWDEDFLVVPPGKRSCPFHSHRGEEEMFFIVRGTGTLRYGDETRKIRAGDVICCPTGGPETAHQIVNDSDAELAYLSISTMMPAEICEYPDSGKVGGFAEGFRHMTRREHHLDYWTGEI